VIFGRENNFTGDGVFTAIKVFRHMTETHSTLAELASCMEDFPQVLINVAVSRTPPLDEVPKLRDRLLEAEATLGKEGRVLFRYSGTERKARIMVEGREQNLVGTLARSLAEAIQKEIG
jgi:phosphoglucosamine mutase